MKRAHFTHKYLLSPTHPITVNLIGCGGTGSMVLSCLGRIDYSLRALGHPGLHVTAFDPDEVSEANIGRQLFSVPDEGLNKASVLITRINRFFATDWEAVPERFSDQYSYANITISCVDNIKSRIEIGEILRSDVKQYDDRKKLYWLDFGNSTDRGQVVLGTVQEMKQPNSEKYETVSRLRCVDEMFDLSQLNDEDSGPSCSLAEALEKQDLFINSTLAQHGSHLLWKLLTSAYIECQGLYLNLSSINVNQIKL